MTVRTEHGVTLATLALLAGVAADGQAQVFNGGIPSGYTCVGVCATSAANGALPLAPGGGARFGYVTTSGSTARPNPFGIAGTTNGSQLTSGLFTATAGQELSFGFNYITSDGTSTFPDYAYVQLIGGTVPITLFTARTTPTGNTVPGFGLPGIAPGVALTPNGTAIVTGPGSTTFSGLGGDSGDCYRGFGQGCGNTGWVIATFAIPTAGNYQLLFGVSNFTDQLYDSALAFDFATGAGNVPTLPPTTVPEPGTWALLGAGLLGLVGVARRRRGAS